MPRRAPDKLLAAFSGVALVLLGVAGFVPGVTSHLGSIRFAGAGSHAELLGTFRVSVLANALHLGLGAPGLVLAGSAATARRYVAGCGASLLALWALGAVSAGRFVPLAFADNWLHFALGIALLGLGALAARVRDVG